jgi:hypothetical protein
VFLEEAEIDSFRPATGHVAAQKADGIFLALKRDLKA